MRDRGRFTIIPFNRYPGNDLLPVGLAKSVRSCPLYADFLLAESSTYQEPGVPSVVHALLFSELAVPTPRPSLRPGVMPYLSVSVASCLRA